jgi:hypothetical protein
VAAGLPRQILLALAAIVLLGAFSPELADSDSWWHLKTGQYIVEHRALPAPDPFAFTTVHARDAYPGEAITRYFNLTHEWLAQAIFWVVYKVGGFPALILFRASILTVFCAIVGLIVYRRTNGFYRALFAALAAAVIAMPFAVDRPYLFTFLYLAITVLILDARRGVWLLPPIFLLWANSHGGFFLGWVVLAAYTLQNRKLLVPVAAALGASLLNPNTYHVIPVLLDYRSSFLQSKLLEWTPPPLWPPQPFEVLLVAAAVALWFARRRVQLAEWILFAAFTAASLSATRNAILAGFIAPILIASYVTWKRPVARFVPYAAAALLLAVLAAGVIRGSFFQLRTADWRYPKGAADFLIAHRITAPMFNTYEYGGYLMWRLWPQEKVFIDGRALSESVFRDYAKILYDREDARAQLDRYGIQLMVMNGFQSNLGLVYEQALHTDWPLVYADRHYRQI